MVDMKRPSKKSFDHVDTHVIFIHGLNGHVENTWISGEGSDSEFWPQWLEEELSNVAVWSVGYEADRLKWGRGIAMAVQDRAANILPRLLAEPELAKGNIVLVGHSMGGVLIKEILRLADRQAGTMPAVASFESRVRKTVFIATPHFGSWMSSIANWLGVFLRPTPATAGLANNDPHLHDLNAWFRDYATKHRLSVMGLGETLGTRFGQVVYPNSSDLGLPSPAEYIKLTEDHFTIVAPPTRASDTYVHLKRFVQQEPQGVNTSEHHRQNSFLR